VSQDVLVRIALGLLLIILGVAALGAGAFGDFGDGRLVSMVLGGAAVLFGIGMLIKGAMRTAIWALAAVVFVVGGGIALVRSLG
jgi:hypothetical protein